MTRKGLTKQLAIEQRQEGGEGVSPVDVRRKNMLGSENSMCKGPGVAHLVCSTSSRKPSAAKAKRKGKEIRGELRQVVWAYHL